MALAIRRVFGLEIKQLGKYGFLLVVAVAMIVLVVTVMAAMSPELRVDRGLWICRLLWLWRIALRGNWLRNGCGGQCPHPLDDLIQFSSIKPHASALWAVVYLDAVTLGHHQGYIAMRTIHKTSPSVLGWLQKAYSVEVRTLSDSKSRFVAPGR